MPGQATGLHPYLKMSYFWQHQHTITVNIFHMIYLAATLLIGRHLDFNFGNIVVDRNKRKRSLDAERGTRR